MLRVVESQEQIATNHLVDDLEKQAALEDMLDNSKPPSPSVDGTLHYLLATPFRYLPLPFGSRFGAKHEPRLFYGSLTTETAFAETGYYRFLFWLGMSSPPPSKNLVTQHTIFSVPYKTDAGLKLQNPPFSDYQKQLLNPANYEDTQNLGHAMRDNNIDAFEYLSARDNNRGVNVALFTAGALAATKPNDQEQWICETTHESVRFYSIADRVSYSYRLNRYHVGEEFPEPAL